MAAAALLISMSISLAIPIRIWKNSALFRWTSVQDKALLPLNGKPIHRLGIGFPYFAALPADLYRSDLVAFVEIHVAWSAYGNPRRRTVDWLRSRAEQRIPENARLLSKGVALCLAQRASGISDNCGRKRLATRDWCAFANARDGRGC